MRFNGIIITLCLITLYTFTSAQNVWKTVGSGGFSDGEARHQDLALEPGSGTPFVAYKDMANGGGTTVKKFDGSQWVSVGIDSFSEGSASYQSLAFKPNSGTPYVAYKDVENNFGATVQKFTNGEWKNVGVPNLSDGRADYVSLTFNPQNGNPYLAYKDNAKGDGATVKKFNGSRWETVGTDSFSDGRAVSQSLAINPNTGTPYLAYRDEANGKATTVMKFNGLKWVTVGKDSFSAGESFNISLAIVPNTGTPHVAYSDRENGSSITVKKFDGTQWVTLGTEGFTGDRAKYKDLSINPNSGTLILGYQDFGNGFRTTVKQFDGNQWVTLGSEGFSDGTAEFQSLAINPKTGTRYIAYKNQGNAKKTIVKKFEGGQRVIKGLVSFQGSALDQGEVSLWQKETNSVTKKDSISLQPSDNGQYSFQGVDSGKYLIRAIADSNSNFAGQAVPTYHDSALSWNQASEVNTQTGVSIQGANISMDSAQNRSGSGSISGLVVQTGPGKRLGPGDPQGGVEVLALTGDGEPEDYTFSNEEGRFEFENIAVDSYNVRVEIPGFQANEEEVQLSNQNPTADSIRFGVNKKEGIVYAGRADHLREAELFQSYRVFPNPAFGEVKVHMESKVNQKIDLTLWTAQGQKVKSETRVAHEGKNAFKWDISSLPKGAYFMKLNGSKRPENYKLRKLIIFND